MVIAVWTSWLSQTCTFRHIDGVYMANNAARRPKTTKPVVVAKLRPAELFIVGFLSLVSFWSTLAKCYRTSNVLAPM